MVETPYWVLVRTVRSVSEILWMTRRFAYSRGYRTFCLELVPCTRRDHGRVNDGRGCRREITVRMTNKMNWGDSPTLNMYKEVKKKGKRISRNTHACCQSTQSELD